MDEIREKIQSIIDKYEEQLTAKGIEIAASKRYFEAQVSERYGTTDGLGAIFDPIDRARDRKREKEKGYHYEKNKYHCIVLSVLPIDKTLVSREYCKEYAFVLHKVERAHIGLEPRKFTYNENKVLSKIEKHIIKILKRSERRSIQKVCKDTLADALRYSTISKYAYKRRFLNKDRDTWDMIFLISASVLALAFAFALWLVGKLL